MLSQLFSPATKQAAYRRDGQKSSSGRLLPDDALLGKSRHSAVACHMSSLGKLGPIPCSITLANAGRVSSAAGNPSTLNPLVHLTPQAALLADVL
jgi:hypothetical protein